MTMKKLRYCSCGTILGEYPDKSEIICPSCGAFNFLGFDFSELFVAYGLELLPSEEESDEAQMEAIKKHMGRMMSYVSFPEHKHLLTESAGILRQFLKALIPGGGYWKPVYKGLLAVKEDFTLFQATIPLVGHLWT